MGLFSLIAVLLIEQFQPLAYRSAVHEPLARLADFLEERLNAGERKQGVIAWLFGVGGLVLLASAVYAAFLAINPLLAWAWNVVVLYLTMGFRQFSHHYSDIESALRMDDLPRARTLLAQWRGHAAKDLSPSAVARLAIEEALAASHRHVFGVLVCFIVLPGPCGAVLYRAAAFFAAAWGRRDDADGGRFGRFAQQAFTVIDWLPVRVAAAGFAVVSDFEDAIYCWRTQAPLWPARRFGDEIGIVLASGAGALGARLGAPVHEAGGVVHRVELGTSEEAGVDFMQSAVGLVWSAMLLWLVLLLLFSFAGLVGA